MNIIINILLVLAIFAGFLLFLAIFMRKKHYVKSEIIINAPKQKVFDYIRFLKNQDEFNTHAMAGPDRTRSFKGVDGTVGYIYSWKGDKSAGEGEKEIRKIIEGKSIEAEIRFIKPMNVSATVIMDTEALSDNQTKVSWSNAGKLNYPVNLMIPMMERSVIKGMNESLNTLKSIMEK